MSRKKRYTPGPWSIFDLSDAIHHGNAPQSCDGTGYRITGKHTLFVELFPFADGFVSGANEANANLISAAPDLLEALERVVVIARTSGGTAGPDSALQDACTKAEDVIAKAYGEET